MLTLFALIGVLVTGVILGLVWRGAVVFGDRQALNRLASQIEAERRMNATTHATLQAMRRAVHQRTTPL